MSFAVKKMDDVWLGASGHYVPESELQGFPPYFTREFSPLDLRDVPDCQGGFSSLGCTSDGRTLRRAFAKSERLRDTVGSKQSGAPGSGFVFGFAPKLRLDVATSPQSVL